MEIAAQPPPILTNWVDGRVWVDLECVDIITGILEQPIVRVEHVLTQQVQPLSSNASIVQSILTSKLDQQFLLQLWNTEVQDLPAEHTREFSKQSRSRWRLGPCL